MTSDNLANPPRHRTAVAAASEVLKYFPPVAATELVQSGFLLAHPNSPASSNPPLLLLLPSGVSSTGLKHGRWSSAVCEFCKPPLMCLRFRRGLALPTGSRSSPGFLGSGASPCPRVSLWEHSGCVLGKGLEIGPTE